MSVQREKGYASKLIYTLVGEIATSELDVFKKLRERGPSKTEGTAATARFNETAKRAHYDDLDSYIRLLYIDHHIDEKTCVGMLLVTGLAPMPKSPILQASANTHKHYRRYYKA